MKYLIRIAIVRGKLLAQFKRTKEEQVIEEIVDLTSNNVMNQQDKLTFYQKLYSKEDDQLTFKEHIAKTA